MFPYNIGRQFYGTASGGVVMGGTYPEAVTTNFVGGANSALRLQPPALSNGGADVTLTWSSTEGGTYVVSAGTNFQTWATNTIPSVTATSNVARATESGGAFNRDRRFYKATRSGLAPYTN